MHIVQLANFYGPRSGGIRTALDQLGRGYVGAGHRRTLVVPGEEHGDDVRGDDRVVTIAAPVVPRSGGYRLITDRRRVADVIAADRPDAIELSDKTTLLPVARAARRRGVPVVLISHERLDAVLRNALGPRVTMQPVVTAWNRRLARSADVIACASDFAAGEFRRIDQAHVRRIRLGVDLRTFRPVDVPRPPLPTVVVAVRLSPEKRPEILVETSRVLERAGVVHRMVVFGDGPLRARLERAARGLPVEFRGHVSSREALASEMACADVAIAPGPAETFGLAALEMLACGTPVVVPEEGALREVVGDAGVVATRTPDAFAAAVSSLLLGDRDTQRALARARAERYTWGAAVGSMLTLYDELVERQLTAERSYL